MPGYCSEGGGWGVVGLFLARGQSVSSRQMQLIPFVEWDIKAPW